MDWTVELANLLFPDVTETPEEIKAGYPPRGLPEGAMVTRLAPSPTGELHVGTLYAAFFSYRLAAQSGGAFYVRLDDTDQRREVRGAGERIARDLRAFGIDYREGFFGADGERGAYGPYVQSARRGIYRAFAKRLVREGKAYPCFCGESELSEMRARQKEQGAPIGYSGEWAVCRRRGIGDVRGLLGAGKPFVLRLKSPGDPLRRVRFRDLFKGLIDLPENAQDIVLIKSDGLPTYHFAHAVDDHLMGTTHVLRGDEWLSSYPVHRQLFEALGFPPPVYGHLAPIMKQEGASRRKFSKRRDRDGHAAYYDALGFPPLALREYYMRLINSGYEDWRRAHPGVPLEEYRIDLKNFGAAGPVFDLSKLTDISKDVIAAMSADEACTALSAWAGAHDLEFSAALARDPDYARAVLGIGRGTAKPRKDIAKWSDARGQLGYFWDEFFAPLASMDARERALLRACAEWYDPGAAQETWFARFRDTAASMGYAPDRRAYAQSPAEYAGTIADAAAALRRALTGRENAPDLYDILRALGKPRARARMLRGAEEPNISAPPCPQGIDP